MSGLLRQPDAFLSTAGPGTAHAAWNAWSRFWRPYWMPRDAALQGPQLDHLMKVQLLWMAGLFFLAQALLVYLLFKPRAESGRKSAWAVWLPLSAVAVLFAWMTLSAQHWWESSHSAGAAPAAMQVEVVGEQFVWHFRYPGPDATFAVTKPELADAAEGNPLGIDPSDPNGKDDVVTSELVLPLGRQVDIRLRSADVIHGFFMPAMRVKEDAVPGMILHLHFTPVRAGEFPILCSQLCGIGHARMQARLLVVTPQRFAVWLADREQRRAAILAAETGSKP